MAKLSRLAGSTGHVLGIYIQDSSKTDGSGLTGLGPTSSGLTCYYKRNRGTGSVAVALTSIATLGTYVSGGFREVDPTGMPGVYEFHPPDAAYATGSSSVDFLLRGAANMVQCPIEIELTATDNQSATGFITGIGGTAAPARWNLMAIDANGRVDLGAVVGTPPTIVTAGYLPVDVEKVGGTGPVTLGAPVALAAGDTDILHSGTAQAGASTTITLASAASALDGFYKGARVLTTGGTGAGQERLATGYVGSTRVATVNRAWAVTPDATTTYAVKACESPAADANLAVTAGTVSDKTGYALSTAGIQAIWDILRSATYAVGGMGAAFKAWLATLGSDSKVAITADPHTAGATVAAVAAPVTAGTVSDKAGYTLASSQTFSTTGSVGGVTNPVTVGTNNDKTGYALAGAGLDAVTIESGINARQALALTLAAEAGTIAGMDTGSPTISAAGHPGTPRIQATGLGTSGNRPNVTLSPPS